MEFEVQDTFMILAQQLVPVLFYNVAGSGNNYFAGNVGIDTSSPVKKLDVVGDINATGDVFARGINLTATVVYSSPRLILLAP